MPPTHPFRRAAPLLAALAVVALAACDDDGPTDPTSDRVEDLVVMSRNLYLGGDIGRVISAPTPESVPVRVTETWVEVLRNDALSRMSALADEIAAAGAHVVGLQEAPIFRIQAPGDVLQGNPVQAETVALDLLSALLAELGDRGLDFTAAAASTNIDVELPMAFSETDFWDLRFTDRDVLLVRSDLDFDDADAGTFQASAELVIGGAVPLEVVRGWTRADVRVGPDEEVRILNVHLEIPEISGPLQEAQMAESLAMMEGAGRGILIGDLNSRADGSTTASYGMARSAGFLDAWLEAGRPEAPTCCYSSDLRSAGLVSEQRIDFVLFRAPEGDLVVTDASLTGDDPGLRTPSGLWPSDHRGVVATFEVR